MLSPNTENPNSEASNDNTLILTNFRIACLTIITAGYYIFYWLYLTWKQMDSETDNRHYPVWHALSLLVPIYGLFRMYDHLKTIKTLAAKNEIETDFSPTLPLLLMFLYLILGYTASKTTGDLSLIILIISLALVTTAILLTQPTLNAYWQKTKGPDVKSALFDRIELGFIVLIYPILWLNLAILRYLQIMLQ